jgi:nucleotide-binding universal stress UspA family protein
VAALAVLATLETVSLLVGLGLAAVSLAWYFLWARSRTEVQGAVGGWLRERRPLRSLVHGGAAPERRTGPHVLVGFAEDAEEADPLPLLRLGSQLAAGIGADLDVVRVRLVPEAVPLDRAWEKIDDERSAADEERIRARLADATGAEVEIHAHTRPARSLAHGVLGATETVERVSLILLAEDSPTVGKGADANVRDDYHGDVAMLSRRAAIAAEPKLLRVGVSESPHAALALRLARQLARSTGARIELVRVASDDDGFADDAAVRRWAARQGGADGEPPQVRVERASSIADGLQRLARDADLLMLGAGEHPLRGGRIGDTARKVVRGSEAAVLVVWTGDGEA